LPRMTCGARWDEHEAGKGPCARTKCEQFFDPYYALNEGHAPWEPKPKPPEEEPYRIPWPRLRLMQRGFGRSRREAATAGSNSNANQILVIGYFAAASRTHRRSPLLPPRGRSSVRPTQKQSRTAPRKSYLRFGSGQKQNGSSRAGSGCFVKRWEWLWEVDSSADPPLRFSEGGFAFLAAVAEKRSSIMRYDGEKQR
jgi:hypothetical protein